MAQRVGEMVFVLDEMVLENANTPTACEASLGRIRELLPRTLDGNRYRAVKVDVYGDASGHQRRTSGTGTDWSLIREFFRQPVVPVAVRVRAGVSNPSVRDRVNLMNSRLCSATGERRLVIDPRCKELIRDLERVRWKVDERGQPTSELDKSDRRRTHVSDALGYYVSQAFPIRPLGGYVGGGRIV